MSILQLVGNLRKALHIVCVPVGRDPDMVLVIFKIYETFNSVRAFMFDPPVNKALHSVNEW